MKNITKLLTVVGLAIGLTSASANYVWEDIELYPSGNAGTFDIAALGYDPALHVIDSAIMSFSFTGTGTKGFLPNSPNLYACVALTTVGNYAGVSSSSTISWGGGGGLSAALLADLSLDGLIDFSAVLGQYGSSLTVKSAKLTVQGSDQPSVPEGGATAALLGLGILALGAFKRKFNAA